MPPNPSSKLRAIRRRVEQRRERAAERKQKVRTDIRRAGDKLFGRTAAAEEEARETKREAGLLARQLTKPARKAASGLSSAAQKVGEAGDRAQGALEGLDDEFGDPRRLDRGTVRELESAGVEAGVQAGNTAFRNRIKRRVKKERLEDLTEAERDALGMAGVDFGTDLEIVDDFERGEAMEGMGDVGLDVTFDALEEGK